MHAEDARLLTLGILLRVGCIIFAELSRRSPATPDHDESAWLIFEHCVDSGDVYKNPGDGYGPHSSLIAEYADILFQVGRRRATSLPASIPFLRLVASWKFQYPDESSRVNVKVRENDLISNKKDEAQPCSRRSTQTTALHMQ